MVDTISFRCDACETNLQVPGDAAAKRIICTTCGAPVKVPVLFEGPAIAYEDAPPAPNIFAMPTTRRVKGPPAWMQWVKLAAGLAIAGGAVAILWFAINKALVSNQADEETSKAYIAAAQQRAARERVAEEQAAKDRAEKDRINAAAKAATAAAKLQSDQELLKLQLEQERLKRELAAIRTASKPAPTQVAAKPILPANDSPSVEQLEKDTKRLNAEMIVARTRATKGQEDVAFYKSRLACLQNELTRQQVAVRSQEMATQRIANAVPYTETRVNAALKLEEQEKQKLDRLNDEADKCNCRLLQAEAVLPNLEEVARQATANYAATREILKQLNAASATTATTTPAPTK